ncbi:MAG TPA: helix-hairpin-helix domain-containing protein [Candidatus Methylomirabilis sp.]|nr:helix-hairpin-helix domain-containing protein [Candidatus Methylomirabilis sp.]
MTGTKSVLVGAVVAALTLGSVLCSPVSVLAQATKTAPAAKVDINSATQAELEQLPGVGEATAKKIIAGRPYQSVADLRKAGVSKKEIDKITPMVMVGGAAAAPAAAAPAAPAAPSKVTASTTSKGSADKTEARVPPAKGMVWVNTKSKVYHLEGDRWYGKTKEGKFMTEDEAIKAGYHLAKEGASKQGASKQ